MPNTEVNRIPLRIAFVGYNGRHARQQFRRFAYDNEELIRGFNPNCGEIKLYDGTVIKLITETTTLQGRRFDQVVIADDWRENVSIRQCELLQLLDYACSRSYVPEEYRFQYYYSDEPEADILGRTEGLYGRTTV